MYALMALKPPTVQGINLRQRLGERDKDSGPSRVSGLEPGDSNKLSGKVSLAEGSQGEHPLPQGQTSAVKTDARLLTGLHRV